MKFVWLLLINVRVEHVNDYEKYIGIRLRRGEAGHEINLSACVIIMPLGNSCSAKRITDACYWYMELFHEKDRMS